MVVVARKSKMRLFRTWGGAKSYLLVCRGSGDMVPQEIFENVIILISFLVHFKQ